MKTHTRNLIEKHRGDSPLPDDLTVRDICAGFQEAVVDTLVIKCRRAMSQTGMKTLVIAGGVSANTRLRHKLKVALEKEGVEVFYARHEFCTDNAAMIAMVGLEKFKLKQFSKLDHPARPRWPLDDDAVFLKGAGVQL